MRFRKKPIVIDAVRYTKRGEYFDKGSELRKFLEGADWSADINGNLIIHTLEGEMTVFPGDWIIKGIDGEFYPCKDNIFARTYEAVE